MFIRQKVKQKLNKISTTVTCLSILTSCKISFELIVVFLFQYSFVKVSFFFSFTILNVFNNNICLRAIDNFPRSKLNLLNSYRNLNLKKN